MYSGWLQWLIPRAEVGAREGVKVGLGSLYLGIEEPAGPGSSQGSDLVWLDWPGLGQACGWGWGKVGRADRWLPGPSPWAGLPQAPRVQEGLPTSSAGLSVSQAIRRRGIRTLLP